MKCQICNQDYIEQNQPCPHCGNVSSPITQDWCWQDKAPGPQSVTAGETWQFRLPLIGMGTAPRCQWLNLPGQQQIVPSDNLILEIKIPLDQKSGISKLEYRIEGHEHLNGTLLLKVLPPTTAINYSIPVTITEEPLPGDNLGKSAVNNLLTSFPPTSSESAHHLPEPTILPQIQAHTSPTGVYPTESHPSTPALLIDSVYIQVFRASIPIPQLKTRLEPHQSLLIGKRSDSKRIFPDIDLKGHFSDSQNEAFCSREQARVYINNHHAFLLNLGKSPLQSETYQTHIAQGNAYNWQLNEIIQLPGGLKLKLVDLC
jgi:hypothetical protein